MTRPPVRDIAISVRDRLQNHARASGEDFQHVLVRYGIEQLMTSTCRPRCGANRRRGAAVKAAWSL